MDSLPKVNALHVKMIKIKIKKNYGTAVIAVIQAIGSGMNEETLMKATHTMIRKGQFGICIKKCKQHFLINHKSY
jgi:hypothetical protein